VQELPEGCRAKRIRGHAQSRSETPAFGTKEVPFDKGSLERVCVIIVNSQVVIWAKTGCNNKLAVFGWHPVPAHTQLAPMTLER
jgi:hypothetical protein